MKKRIEYVDIIKGIGILLVVLGHSIGYLDQPINRAILAFHMPLFFVVSGFLFYGKDLKSISPVVFIKRKMFTILLPQITAAIIGFLYKLAVNLIKRPENSVLGFINLQFLVELFGWFLIVLFLMEVVMFFCLRITDKYKFNVIFMLSALILFFILPTRIGYFDNLGLLGDGLKYLYRTILQLILALFFGYLGLVSRNLIERYHNCVKVHGVGFLGYCIIIVLALYNEPIGMYVNSYGNKYMFMLLALIGIASTIDLAFLLEKSYLLTYIGQNSIIIYVTHFTLLEFVWALVSILFDWKFGSFPWFLIIFVIICVIEIFVIIFANKYVPFLFGKKKSEKKIAIS